MYQPKQMEVHLYHCCKWLILFPSFKNMHAIHRQKKIKKKMFSKLTLAYILHFFSF